MRVVDSGDVNSPLATTAIMGVDGHSIASPSANEGSNPLGPWISWTWMTFYKVCRDQKERRKSSY